MTVPHPTEHETHERSLVDLEPRNDLPWPWLNPIGHPTKPLNASCRPDTNIICPSGSAAAR